MGDTGQEGWVLTAVRDKPGVSVTPLPAKAQELLWKSRMENRKQLVGPFLETPLYSGVFRVLPMPPPGHQHNIWLKDGW